MLTIIEVSFAVWSGYGLYYLGFNDQNLLQSFRSFQSDNLYAQGSLNRGNPILRNGSVSWAKQPSFVSHLLVIFLKNNTWISCMKILNYFVNNVKTAIFRLLARLDVGNLHLSQNKRRILFFWIPNWVAFDPKVETIRSGLHPSLINWILSEVSLN